MTEAFWKEVAADTFPWVDTAQMIEIDRIMIEDLQIELKQMMENAGRNLAILTLGLFAPRTVTVLAGSGGNGGGGLVCARHLANHGVAVTVVVTRPAAEFWGVPAHQLGILQRMGIDVIDQDPSGIEGADVIVDAVIGYSLRGAPRGSALAVIDAANHSNKPVVSLDVPSGVDSTTGDTPGAAVRADATLTLAAPKVGLRSNMLLGRLFVGDISVPPAAFESLGLRPPPAFNESWLVEITR
jgi:NAD(P)H-hydrate epimerase